MEVVSVVLRSKGLIFKGLIDVCRRQQLELVLCRHTRCAASKNAGCGSYAYH